MVKSKVTIGNVDKFKEKIKLMSNNSKKFVAVTMAGLILAGVAYGCDKKSGDEVNTPATSVTQENVDYNYPSKYSFRVKDDNGEVNVYSVDINSEDINKYLKDGYSFDGYQYSADGNGGTKMDMLISKKTDEEIRSYAIPYSGLQDFVKENVTFSPVWTNERRNVDFAGITVVLESNGEISNNIIDPVAATLGDFGVKVYIDDNNCLNSVREALTENPTDDILVIRVGGEKNKTGNTVIMANYNDGLKGSVGLKNSDSLAMAINSELNGSKVVNGRKILNNSITTRDVTEIESDLSTINVADRGLKNVTIAIDEESANEFLISNAIVKGITKYTTMSRSERDDSYYRMAGFVQISASSGKDWQDTVTVNDSPIVDMNVDEYGIGSQNNIK